MLLRMLPVFIVQSVLQKATILNNDNNLKLKEYLNYFYKRGLTITLIVGVLFAFCSEWIIVIFAGEEIRYSSKILSLLSFVPFLAMLNFKNILIILIDEKKEILNKATWISAFFMIVISFILTYLFGGVGLAFSLLVSEIISFFVHFFLLSKNNVKK